MIEFVIKFCFVISILWLLMMIQPPESYRNLKPKPRLEFPEHLTEEDKIWLHNHYYMLYGREMIA